MKEKLESLAQSYIESIAPSDPNFDISTLKYEYDIFMLGAEAAVKLLTAPDVSKCEDVERRTLLIAFLQWFFDNEAKIDGDPETEGFVDIYLESN